MRIRLILSLLALALPALSPLPARSASIPAKGIAPYPGAPLCPDTGTRHVTTRFHGLWDAQRGCHYDHEHGDSPFTAAVASAFPGFNLKALLGYVEIGHTNPSSPMENTMKHAGFKWQVSLHAPHGCAAGFEGGKIAVDAYAIEYHTFGVYSMELESRNHSTAALLRQCKPSNPADKGYIFLVQLQEYGQRVSPYQGTVIGYPDSPQPAYAAGSGPYFTTDCVGIGLPGCRASLDQILRLSLNTNSIWTSKPTGGGTRPPTSRLFRLLFRVRDTYQVFDSADLTYPFTFRYICGDTTYAPAGCRYNNSTSTIHEIAGRIPASWDGLPGFDSDPRPGRITATGFVTRFGALKRACRTPGTYCYPIKLVNAFVGYYSSELSARKVGDPTPANTPERDIYFCSNGAVCSEISPGAVPSGWIGPEN